MFDERMNRMLARGDRTVDTTRRLPTLAGAIGAIAVLALGAVACGDDDDDEVGGGITLARADWDTGWIQSAIYAELLTELGYEVSDPAGLTVTPSRAYAMLDTREVDLWVDGWFPLHDQFLTRRLPQTGQEADLDVDIVGMQTAGGALQGYMVDKASADELGITSMDDVIEHASVFDQSGNGMADLIGCNEEWGCHEVINDHIDEFGWSDDIEHVFDEYSELIEGVIARVDAGEPVLFYTFTPNWVIEEMTPGEDVVWVESPALPDDENTVVDGLPGCATGADACDIGWEINDMRAVANADFLSSNSPVERLLEVVEIPLADIQAQNARMHEAADYTEDDLRQDAQAWIADNRDLVDEWLEQARGG